MSIAQLNYYDVESDGLGTKLFNSKESAMAYAKKLLLGEATEDDGYIIRIGSFVTLWYDAYPNDDGEIEFESGVTLTLSDF